MRALFIVFVTVIITILINYLMRDDALAMIIILLTFYTGLAIIWLTNQA